MTAATTAHPPSTRPASTKTAAAPDEQLEGVITEVAYSNERDWHVLQVRTAAGQLVRATGVYLRPVSGTQVRLTGRYTDSERKRFAFGSGNNLGTESSAAALGTLVQALGIDATVAARIIGQFGSETLAVLDRDPLRLHEVPGLDGDASVLAARWRQVAASDTTKRALADQGVATAVADRLAQRLGADPSGALARNPYLPVLLFDDVAFEKIDAACRKRGTPVTDRARLSAGVVMVLRRRALGGHTFIERATLSTALIKEVGLNGPPPETETEGAIQIAVEHGVVIAEQGRVGLRIHHEAEIAVVERLQALAAVARDVQPPSAERLRALFQRKYGEDPGEADGTRLAHLLRQKLGVLNGPLAALRTLLPAFLAHAFQVTQCDVRVVCPTLAAAERITRDGALSESLVVSLDAFVGRGVDGSVVHHRAFPIAIDVVIIAEADRLTLADTVQLLDALPAAASVYWIGDIARLPPTGAGQPFLDLVRTRWLYTQNLPDNSVFVPRTSRPLFAQLSLLRKGHAPGPVNLDDPSAPLIYFPLTPEETDRIGETLDVLVREALPVLLRDFVPARDLLLLSPVRKKIPRAPSLPELNALLARSVNPTAERVTVPPNAGEAYGAGDPVFVRRADPALGLPFGARGVVEKIDQEAHEIHVQFARGLCARVPFTRANRLTAGYATTAYQASGFLPRCGVVLLLAAHDRQLNQTLLYSALSCARERAVILAEPAALETALTRENHQVADVGLSELLRALPRPSINKEGASGSTADREAD